MTNTEQMNELAADIELALGKGHRGYTIRGAQMDWVMLALRYAAKNIDPPKKLVVDVTGATIA